MSHPLSLATGAIPPEVQLENNRGQRILALADWQRLAPPASRRHWRQYRSAYELAHAWTESDGAHRLHELRATRARRPPRTRSSGPIRLRAGIGHRSAPG
jgi:hypothetical protein